MFPWSPEFAWDAGHLAFFGALYAVLGVVGTTALVAAWRSLRLSRSGAAPRLAWHAAFAELPPAARACRHQLTGEAAGRVCPNAFDCRECAEHPRYEAQRDSDLRAASAGQADELSVGERFYHRGHTWTEIAPDGTLTVGLDEMACRLLGTPDRLELPANGARVETNGLLARVSTRGSDVRLVSPVDGTVERIDGRGLDFRLRIRPGATLDLRHLLSGKEASLWLLRELERLQVAVAPAGEPLALADGGTLVADVGAALPRDRFDALLGEMFLEP